MSRFVYFVSLTVTVLALAIPATGSAQDGNSRLRIDLSGFNEVHGPTLGIGAIFSTGTGRSERA